MKLDLKKVTSLLLTCLLLLPLFAGVAEGSLPASETALTQQQMEESLGKADVLIRQVTQLDGVFYVYLSDSSVCTWNPEDAAINPLCQLPDSTATAYENASPDEKAQWQEIVHFLAAGDGKVWGVNIFSGKVGVIDESGVTWSDVTLDTKALTPEDSPWSLRIVDAFVADNQLYAYAALDDQEFPHNNYLLARFDLTTGEAALVDIQNAQGLCRYRQGSCMLLFYEDSQ